MWRSVIPPVPWQARGNYRPGAIAPGAVQLIIDPSFSGHSYGRPGLRAHDAVRLALNHDAFALEHGAKIALNRLALAESRVQPDFRQW